VAFGATVAAQAGTLSTAVAGGTLFAVEDFTGSFSGTSGGITPGVVTYTVGTTNGIVVNAGGTIYFTVRLAGGTFKAAPLAAQITGTALAVGGGGNGVVSAGVLSSDSTTATFAVTYTAGVTLGVGSTFAYTPPANGAATAIVGVKSALGTVGGTVTATASLSAITPVVQAPSATTAPNTGTAQAADIDGPAASAVIAKAVQGVAVSVGSLSTYTGKIDLTASPAGGNYALSATPGVPIKVALGSVTLTDASTAGNDITGGVAVNTASAAAAAATPLTITVTPGTGQAFPIGATLQLDATSNACGALVGAASGAVTAATTTTAITLTAPNANTATATPLYVCMTKPSSGNTAAPITASITGKLDFSINTATSGADSVTGNGYALGYNGSSVTTDTYFPVAIGQYGYSTYTRIVNTGAVTANVSAAFVDGVAGTTGASAVIVSNLAPGAAVLLNNSTIETALGVAPAATARPRLNVTAPTNKLVVQNYVQSANGTFSEVSAEASGSQH